AKVSDFGLLRMGEGSCSVQSTRVMGTPGYVDPVYSITRKATPSADVYSFGVLMMELLACKHVVMLSEDGSHTNIKEWVEQQVERGSTASVVNGDLKAPHAMACTLVEILPFTSHRISHRNSHPIRHPIRRPIRGAMRLAEMRAVYAQLAPLMAGMILVAMGLCVALVSMLDIIVAALCPTDQCPEALMLSAGRATIGGIANIIVAPIFGGLSDKYGRKPFLLLGIAGITIPYAILATSSSRLAVYLFFAAETAGSAVGGSAWLNLIYAYVADVTAEANRAAAFGAISGTTAFGFLAGPLVARFVPPAITFHVATLLCSCGWAYILFMVPESLPSHRLLRKAASLADEEHGTAAAAAAAAVAAVDGVGPTGGSPDGGGGGGGGSGGNVGERTWLLEGSGGGGNGEKGGGKGGGREGGEVGGGGGGAGRGGARGVGGGKVALMRNRSTLREAMHVMSSSPLVSILLLVAFLHAFADNGQTSNMFYVFKAKFHWNKDDFSLYTAGIGLFAVLSQLVLLPLLLQILSLHALLILAISINSFHMILYGLAWKPWVVYLALSMSLVSSLTQTSIGSMVSHLAGPSEQGKLQGVVSGVSSLSAVLAPLTINPITAYFMSDSAPIHQPGAGIIVAGIVEAVACVLVLALPSTAGKADVIVAALCATDQCPEALMLSAGSATLSLLPTSLSPSLHLSPLSFPPLFELPLLCAPPATPALLSSLLTPAALQLSLLADVTEETDRAAAFGAISGTTAVGFLAGPLVARFVPPAITFHVATLLCSCGWVYILCMVPESLPDSLPESPSESLLSQPLLRKAASLADVERGRTLAAADAAVVAVDGVRFPRGVSEGGGGVRSGRRGGSSRESTLAAVAAAVAAVDGVRVPGGGQEGDCGVRSGGGSRVLQVPPLPSHCLSLPLTAGLALFTFCVVFNHFSQIHSSLLSPSSQLNAIPFPSPLRPVVPCPTGASRLVCMLLLVAFLHAFADNGQVANMLYVFKAKFHWGKNDFSLYTAGIGLFAVLSHLLLLPLLLKMLPLPTLLILAISINTVHRSYQHHDLTPCRPQGTGEPCRG
ncbi:unnamed protein product, partial [Closterium sp. Naga37s-1]